MADSHLCVVSTNGSTIALIASKVVILIFSEPHIESAETWYKICVQQSYLTVCPTAFYNRFLMSKVCTLNHCFMHTNKKIGE